jgi:hypothetical protein
VAVAATATTAADCFLLLPFFLAADCVIVLTSSGASPSRLVSTATGSSLLASLSDLSFFDSFFSFVDAFFVEPFFGVADLTAFTSSGASSLDSVAAVADEDDDGAGTATLVPSFVRGSTAEIDGVTSSDDDDLSDSASFPAFDLAAFPFFAGAALPFFFFSVALSSSLLASSSLSLLSSLESLFSFSSLSSSSSSSSSSSIAATAAAALRARVVRVEVGVAALDGAGDVRPDEAAARERVVRVDGVDTDASLSSPLAIDDRVVRFDRVVVVEVAVAVAGVDGVVLAFDRARRPVDGVASSLEEFAARSRSGGVPLVSVSSLSLLPLLVLSSSVSAISGRSACYPNKREAEMKVHNAKVTVIA